MLKKDWNYVFMLYVSDNRNFVNQSVNSKIYLYILWATEWLSSTDHGLKEFVTTNVSFLLQFTKFCKDFRKLTEMVGSVGTLKSGEYSTQKKMSEIWDLLKERAQADFK